VGIAATDPVVRPATADDCPAAARMIELGFALQVAPDLDAQGRATFRHSADAWALAERLQAGNGAWVAVEEGRVVGYAERSGIHLLLLFVHPEHQRRGIARALLNAAVEGLSGVPLTVNASAYAKPIYARLGFVPTGPTFTRNGLTATPMALPR
jgi:GNAT superfamily N-acetyltransferase